MKALDILLKDLRQTVTTWQTPVFLVAMPIAFTIFFGIAFADSGSADPRAPVAVLNSDSGLLGSALVSMVAESSTVRRVEVEDADLGALRAAIIDGDLAGALVVPAGYTRAVLGGDGVENVQALAWYDPGESAGQAASNEFRMALARVLSAAEAARIAADAPGMALDSAEARMAFLEDATLEALNVLQELPVTLTTEMAGAPAEEAGLDNSFAQSSPGMMLQSGITGIMSTATLLVVERKSRTLQRLLSTATARTEIIAGKLLSAFVLVFGQMLLLTGFGQLVYNLPYYSRPGALLLLNATFALTVASLGLLIGSIAKNDEAVVLLTLLPSFLLSALGGAWLPLEVMPQGMRTVGRIVTPTAWAMEAYKDLIVRGQGLREVLPAVGIIAVWGMAFFALAIWRLRFVES